MYASAHLPPRHGHDALPVDRFSRGSKFYLEIDFEIKVAGGTLQHILGAGVGRGGEVTLRSRCASVSNNFRHLGD